MALPYKRIPAGIAAFTSPTGKLPSSQLSNVPGVGDFQLQAARSMRALKAAARADGLIVASVGDYRSYDEQVTLFRSRYVHGRNFDNTDRFWHAGTNGGDDQWWKLVSGAPAAEPGTSNHGLGLANDFALNINGQIVSLDTKTGPKNINLYDWLSLFGGRYGWNWGETQSERWHWVYIEGDVIPAAVLSFERAHNIVFDFAFTFTDPLVLAAAGIAGVARYAGDLNDPTQSKLMSKRELDAHIAAGYAVAAVKEDSGNSWTTGYSGGLTAGRQAATWRVQVGWPSTRPIYCANFDTNIPAGQFATAAEHMRGFNDGQGLGPQGAYAEGDLIDYLFSHGLIRFGWQSASDSFPGNANDTPNAAMCQRVRATFPQFPTGTYDENDIHKTDWGQIPAPQGDDDVAAPFALMSAGGITYAVDTGLQSKLALSASALKGAQAILAINGFPSTVLAATGDILNLLNSIPLVTDDASAAQVTDVANRVAALGAPAQAGALASFQLRVDGQTKAINDHLTVQDNQAATDKTDVLNAIAAAPPGSGMTEATFRTLVPKIHQDSVPGHQAIDP